MGGEEEDVSTGSNGFAWHVIVPFVCDVSNIDGEDKYKTSVVSLLVYDWIHSLVTCRSVRGVSSSSSHNELIRHIFVVRSCDVENT